MLVGQMIPAPVGGVTQVPPKLRGPGQVTEAINTYPDLLRGLGVRKGTEVVAASVELARPSTGKEIEWSPGSGERYIVNVSQSGVLVTDIHTGQIFAPSLADDLEGDGESIASYLDGFLGTGELEREFSTAIVGDQVFIASKGFTVAEWAAVQPEPDLESFPYAGTYPYAIVTIEDYVPGLKFDFRWQKLPANISGAATLGTDDPDVTEANRTESSTAAYLAAQWNASVVLSATFTLTAVGPNIFFRRTSNGAQFTLRVSDNKQGHFATVTKDVISTLDDLPSVAPENYILTVSSVAKSGTDDFYLQYTAENGWQEVVQPLGNVYLNNYRMPWVLKVSHAGGGTVFTFGPRQWSPRIAGNDLNNPLPELFPIDCLFTAEQRLGMTSGPTVVLSATGRPFQLFRKTVQQLLSDDPINVRTALGPESSYHDAIEWDNATFLWNDRAQVRISGDPVLSPTTIAMSIESRFENSARVSPVVLGSRVYYVQEVNGYTRVYEYWRPPGYNMPPTVTDITASVPTYLQGTPKNLTGDEALGVLCVHTEDPGDDAQDHIYVCHFSRDGNGAIQPRWHTWQFPDTDIHSAHMVASRLYFVLTRTSGSGESVRLESLDVANPHDMRSGIPGDSHGAIPFTPEITMEGFFIRDQTGAQVDTRFTISNFIVHCQDTRQGRMFVDGEDLDRVTIEDTPAFTDALRVPMMRTNNDLILKFQWFGFLNELWMQGPSRSRGRRM